MRTGIILVAALALFGCKRHATPENLKLGQPADAAVSASTVAIPFDLTRCNLAQRNFWEQVRENLLKSEELLPEVKLIIFQPVCKGMNGPGRLELIFRCQWRPSSRLKQKEDGVTLSDFTDWAIYQANVACGPYVDFGEPFQTPEMRAKLRYWEETLYHLHQMAMSGMFPNLRTLLFFPAEVNPNSFKATVEVNCNHAFYDLPIWGSVPTPAAIADLAVKVRNLCLNKK